MTIKLSLIFVNCQLQSAKNGHFCLFHYIIFSTNQQRRERMQKKNEAFSHPKRSCLEHDTCIYSVCRPTRATP